jgi:hypothetical protein
VREVWRIGQFMGNDYEPDIGKYPGLRQGENGREKCRAGANRSAHTHRIRCAQKNGRGTVAPARRIGDSDYPLRHRPRRRLLQHEVAAQQSLHELPQPALQVLQPVLLAMLPHGLQHGLQGACFCT